MDKTWWYIGARLSSRALRILAHSGRDPGDLARSEAETKSLGFTARDVRVLQEATRREEEAALEQAALAQAAFARAAAGHRAAAPEIGTVLTAADPRYPSRFWRLAHPPAAVWVDGHLGDPGQIRVALVGARRATRNGRAFAREVATALAASGIEVWSGLARGIDGAAHAGALLAGRTVAVLGAGLDRVYPPEHWELAQAVRARGALLTEFPPGTQPLAANFPQRNRLLAAAVDALLVVEAGEKSGALITVNWALSLGVPVLVAPGDPLAESCRGSNRLLQAGAPPLLEADDVLMALGLRAVVSSVRMGCSNRAAAAADAANGAAGPAIGAVGPGTGAGGTGVEGRARPAPHPLEEALRAGAMHVDELAEQWEGPTPAAAELVRLELDGRVEGMPGGFYALKR